MPSKKQSQPADKGGNKRQLECIDLPELARIYNCTTEAAEALIDKGELGFVLVSGEKRVPLAEVERHQRMAVIRANAKLVRQTRGDA